jgi:branched-chain amino acid transport system permease protein
MNGLNSGVAAPAALPAVAGDASPLKGRRFDLVPLALFPALMLLVWPFVSASTWLTLTVAGLAMGMIIFIAASGLTLVFGLMDVVNFGHGVFISLGAYVGYTVLRHLPGWTASPDLGLNLAAVGLALFAAAVVAGLTGLIYERVIVRPVYGNHLKQMLITMGGLIVVEEMIKMVWGAESNALQMPLRLRGSWFIGDAAIEKYRLLAVAVGTVLLAAMLWVLNRTKIGLLIRAGVQDREMVESLGYRIGSLFVGVFAAGSVLAGIGGVMWALYQQTLRPQMGGELTILIFVVLVIGGLGSTVGCFVAALLVGLVANYAGFLVPKVALFSNVLLMVLVLLWRPRGVYPMTSR